MQITEHKDEATEENQDVLDLSNDQDYINQGRQFMSRKIKDGNVDVSDNESDNERAFR